MSNESKDYWYSINNELTETSNTEKESGEDDWNMMSNKSRQDWNMMSNQSMEDWMSQERI